MTAGGSDIEVKLFGGASMHRLAAGRKSVGTPEHRGGFGGTAAGRFARRVTSDIGGTEGRKLRFYSATGEVFVKRIRMEADG